MFIVVKVRHDLRAVIFAVRVGTPRLPVRRRTSVAESSAGRNLF